MKIKLLVILGIVLITACTSIVDHEDKVEKSLLDDAISSTTTSPKITTTTLVKVFPLGKHDTLEECEEDWELTLEDQQLFSIKPGKVVVVFNDDVPLASAKTIIEFYGLEGTISEVLISIGAEEEEAYLLTHSLDILVDNGTEISTSCLLENEEGVKTITPDLNVHLFDKIE